MWIGAHCMFGKRNKQYERRVGQDLKANLQHRPGPGDKSCCIQVQSEDGCI